MKASRVASIVLLALLAVGSTCCALKRTKRSPGIIRNSLMSAQHQAEADFNAKFNIKAKVEHKARAAIHEALGKVHIDDKLLRNQLRNLHQQGPVEWSRHQIKQSINKRTRL